MDCLSKYEGESVGERSIRSNASDADVISGIVSFLLIDVKRKLLMAETFFLRTSFVAEVWRINPLDKGTALDEDGRAVPVRLAHPANIAKRTIKHWNLLVNGSQSAVSPKNMSKSPSLGEGRPWAGEGELNCAIADGT